MSLKEALGRQPVIYEVVPPRREPAKFETELRGLDEVLAHPKIDAINIPELFERKEKGGEVVYAPATIPPEAYAVLIKKYKEPLVNVVAPRMEKALFLDRVRRINSSYGVRNIVVVGKERHGDEMPGPTVPEAMKLLGRERDGLQTVGGVCIFDRNSKVDHDYSSKYKLDEHQRVLAKASRGCDFVTSQIVFDHRPAVSFFRAYLAACEKAGAEPITVFVSLTTIPSPSIMSLMDRLDVKMPGEVRRRVLSSNDPGKETVKISSEIFGRILEALEKERITVPVGLQVEQVGVKSARNSLELLEMTSPMIKSFSSLGQQKRRG